MFIHIQCWEVKSDWRSLHLENRVAYFNQIEQIVHDLRQLGVYLVNCPFERRNLAFLRERYLIIWKLSSEGCLTLLEDAIQTAGWRRYFQEVVLSHEMIVPDPHFHIVPIGLS